MWLFYITSRHHRSITVLPHSCPTRRSSDLYVKRNVAVGGDEVLYQDKALYIKPHEGDEFVRANYKANEIVQINGKLWVKNPYMSTYPGITYDSNVDLFAQMLIFYQASQLAMRPVNFTDLPSVQMGLPFNAFYYKVPQDEYFMVGDNRDHSNDSRFWGSVKYKDIVGKPWFVYFSWDDEYVVRWDRIGRFVTTLESDPAFTNRTLNKDLE